MAKITRYTGNVQPPAINAVGTERTIFGGTTQADDLDSNLNADLLRGWGIVPVNGNPTKQDFNAMGFTLGQLIAYMHQAGVPEYNAAQEYFAGGLCQVGGQVYISQTDANIGNNPIGDSGANWAAHGLTQVNDLTTLGAMAGATGRHIYTKHRAIDGDGGGGLWRWDGSNLSTQVAADPQEGVYKAPDSDATGASGAWVRVSNGAVNVRWFGAKGDGITDDTAAFAAAIAASKNVFIPYSTSSYIISNLTVSAGEGVLFGERGTVITFSGTTGTEAILISGDFAAVKNLTFVASDATKDAIKTSGFRNKLENVIVSGASLNVLKIAGLETIVNYGKLKGGAAAGALVTAADAFFNNVYIEQNNDGMYTSGVGSITAFHVHSFNNTRHGFFLSGASASQMHACYADTNGANGFEIRDTTSGLVLVDCWGYKSSNAGAGENDFQLVNAKGVKLIGCRSSGTGAFAKGASFKADTDCQIDLIGCTAEIAPSGFVSGNVTVTNGSAALAKYNRATDVFQSSSVTIADTAAGGVAVDTTVDGAITSPGLLAFEIDLVYRNTAGAQAGVEKKIVVIGVGGPTTSATNMFPAAPGLAISVPTLTLGVNGLYNLAFTVTNTLGFSAQVAANVRYVGTGRGFV